MTNRRLEPLLVAGSCAVAVFAQAAAFNDVRLDDAYITYRYSQNLANGKGFVFNPGERILGTTSPGHALLGAPIYALVGKRAFPAIMAVLGCLGWTLQAVLVYALLRRVIGRAGAAFVAIALAAGAARSYFWVPLETHLVAALVLGAFVLAARKQWLGCAIAGALAAVFRGDALIACGLLGLLLIADQRTRAWKPALVFAAIAGAWGIFSWRYFGTVLPHTVRAKVGHGAVGEYLHHAVFYPALSVAPWSRVADSGIDGAWLTVVLIWGLAIAGVVLLAQRSRVLAALGAYGALLIAAYVALHPDTAFGWHMYPVTLLVAVFALSALALLASRAKAAPFLMWPLASVAVVAFAIEAGIFAQRQPWLPSFGARDSLDHTVSAYLVASAEPGDYVDAEEVGTVAYLSGLPMLDHPGLVSDDAIGQLFAAARGRPSRVRWAILNRWEAETAKATLKRFHRMVFEEDKLQLTVYDLRSWDP